MPLTILTHNDVKSVLLSLTIEQVLDLQSKLSDGLYDYSTGVGANLSNPKFQPPRTVITHPDGLATVFMPASAGEHIGMRVMSAYNTHLPVGVTTEQPNNAGSGKTITTYSPPSEGPSRRVSRESIPEFKPDSNPASRSASQARNVSQQSLDNLSLDTSLLSVADDDTADDMPGSSLATLPASLRGPLPEPNMATSPNGCITLLNETGCPLAIINAQELAAFRTALSSSILFMRRKHVETITVFGAGRQAYWHIYLALLLRGDDIKRVNIINRSFDRTTQLLQDFYQSSRSEWRSNVKFATLCRGFVEYNRLVTASVRKADVIFCCTPSVEPLFKGELLTSGDGLKKGRLVVAIGSYTPGMVELDPEILKYTVKQHTSRYRAHIKHPLSVGVVVVDCLDACLTQCGEVIRANLEPNQLVEIGELVMVRQEVKRIIEERDDGVSMEQALSADDRMLFQWMRKGLVVFKSVGMGFMDLLVGGEVVRIAREMKVGTNIQDF
ncbi:hypothetical protein KEM54_004667 [Ascosphaera aggregata]|nr:hypothetical protein KEM54_004667 [Ascosphaera aggregata]